MAKYKSGINGPFSGKVGSVIGSSWMGKTYIKGKSTLPLRVPTLRQLNQRMVFAMVSSWLRLMKQWIEIGYGNVLGQLPMNAAISFVLKHAVTGVAPDFEIDYPNMVWSRGELLMSLVTKFELQDASEPSLAPIINVEWTNAAPSFYNKGEDMAVFIFYNPVKAQFFVSDNSAKREDARAEIPLPEDFASDIVHGWMFYTREDALSTSIYVGAV